MTAEPTTTTARTSGTDRPTEADRSTGAGPWSIEFVDGPTIGFEPVDLDRHLGLVHGWMHEPHVAPWWELDGTEDEVARYLVGQRALPHLRPWVASADGRPFGYVETYRAEQDPLADAVAAADLGTVLADGDRGWHVLVGPPADVGTGLARFLGRAVLAGSFADPTVRRVVCEPDERNTRMIRYCAGLGHVDLGHLRFGPKTAALLACPRASFAVRFPSDVAATTGGPS